MLHEWRTAATAPLPMLLPLLRAAGNRSSSSDSSKRLTGRALDPQWQAPEVVRRTLYRLVTYHSPEGEVPWYVIHSNRYLTS